MRKLLRTLAAVALLGIATPAAAQIALEANVAHTEDQWGAELGVGYSVLSIGGFRVTPAVGAFLYQGDNDRYEMQDNGGNPRCRDLSNGQYADTDLCDDTAVKIYGRVEATYSIPVAGLTAGLGARLMDGGDIRPYGTAAFPLLPRVSLKGSIGDDYYAAGLQARF